MPIALTVVDSFRHGGSLESSGFKAAFNSTGTYCAVGIDNNYTDAAYGPTGNAEVWIYKLSAGHWTRVAQLVTNGYWDSTETWAVALSDNLTVLSVGNNSAVIHRWKSTGTDTWASDSYFQPNPTDNAGYSYLAFSTDGNVLWTCNDYNGGVPGKIITGISGSHTVRQTWSDATYNPMGGALSADGKRLAFCNLILGRMEIWNSTTLGTSSWTSGGTVNLTGGAAYVQGMRMKPDKSIIVVGHDPGFGGTPQALEVFYNTSGSTYGSLGVLHATDDDTTAIRSFGLTDAGLLVAGTTSDVAWSCDNAGLISGLTDMDEVATPVGVISTDPWAGTVAVDPTGTWACVVGNAWGENVGDDVIRFATIAPYVPTFQFWTQFVKSRETF